MNIQTSQPSCNCISDLTLPPLLNDQSTNQLQIGGNVTMRCINQEHGKRAEKIKFFKNSDLIVNTEKIRITGLAGPGTVGMIYSSLSISTLNEEDIGNYTCRLYNGFGASPLSNTVEVSFPIPRREYPAISANCFCNLLRQIWTHP